MFKKRILTAVAAAFALSCVYAAAETSIPAMKTGVEDGQKAVVQYYTQDSVGDVQLGRLGLSKSRNAAVRALARALVRDHTITAEDGLATARAVGDDDVPFKPGDDNQIQLTRLSRYSGAQFDREYVKTLIDAHQVDIATARDSLEFASAAPLRRYLQSTLAVDERHLRIAQSVQSKL